MSKQARSIDQFCAGFALGDAISNEALIIQDFLRRLGCRSEIFSQHFSAADARYVHHFRNYKRRGDAILIYHHSFHSDFLDILERHPARKVLVFHNTTPPEFARPYNPTIADQLAYTRERLRGLSGAFEQRLADSAYNADDLRDLGFPPTEVMPVPVDFEQWRGLPDSAHLQFLDDGRINLLFVGRVFPNKKHQDLIKAFYYFKKLKPRSRLIMVGSFHPGMRGYTAELMNLARELGLAEDILFTGLISLADIQTYYRKADLFLSMSEHEGFFVPLLECMHFGIPIVAYSSSVIPETLGGSGALFFEKDYVRVAELMAEITDNAALRDSLAARQRERLKDYDISRTYVALSNALERLGVIHP